MDSDITLMLSTATENGKRHLRLCNTDNTSGYSIIKKKETAQIALDTSYAVYKETTEPITIEKAHIEFPTSFFAQFWILLKRMMLIRSRSHTALKVQLVHHILSGLLVGSIFYKVGQNGSLAISNFFFCLCEIVFFMYTHTMTSVLMFPTEVQIVKREYFNRWYSLKAYYAAVIIRNLPLVVSENEKLYWPLRLLLN
ncbi:ATP-binding cassette sub-family G member 1-like [Agrilus planipennis]|uniref:ATP-binding cassette sub-family G member 1-like n=1 Tax=Agrilus planipennis TaxID=224129 RepID=A0A7F5RA12_AGRPL|nr:ATP-binding cassette sub-family G member 1-like [Agrilus planipennis]